MIVKRLLSELLPTVSRKRMFWQRQPACLSIDFVADKAHAQLILDAEPDGTSAQAKDWPAWLKYFLGLEQPTQSFFKQHHQHAELGPLIQRHPGLRVAQVSSPFEAITWAIIRQRNQCRRRIKCTQTFY